MADWGVDVTWSPGLFCVVCLEIATFVVSEPGASLNLAGMAGGLGMSLGKNEVISGRLDSDGDRRDWEYPEAGRFRSRLVESDQRMTAPNADQLDPEKGSPRDACWRRNLAGLPNESAVEPVMRLQRLSGVCTASRLRPSRPPRGGPALRGRRDEPDEADGALGSLP